MMIMAARSYSGIFWRLKFPGNCLTGEENPRKNLTQETCTDRGSNPGPLRDRHATDCSTAVNIILFGGNILQYYVCSPYY